MGTCSLHPTPLVGCPLCEARPCEHSDCGRGHAAFHEDGRWYCFRHAPSQVAKRAAARPRWVEETPTGHGVYVLQLEGNALRCLRDYDSGEWWAEVPQVYVAGSSTDLVAAQRAAVTTMRRALQELVQQLMAVES